MSPIHRWLPVALLLGLDTDGQAQATGALALIERARSVHAVPPGNIVVRLDGEFDLSARFQGLSVAEPTWKPISETLRFGADGVVQASLDWYNYAHSRQRLGEYYLPTTQSGKPALLFSDQNAATQSWMPFWIVPDQASRYRRRLPALLATEMATTGSVALSGLLQVTWTTPSGEVLVVDFEAQPGRIQALQTVLDMPLAGDSIMRWEWQYASPQAAHPEREQVWLNQRLLRRQRIAVDTAAEDLQPSADAPPPPPGIARPEQPRPSAQAPVVKTLLPGIHQIVGLRPGFHLLFVEFDDYVVAIDAPSGWLEMQQLPPLNWSGDSSTALGEKYLAAIRVTTDKPVRYVIATHHHSDHIGGIRAFVDAGVTVVGSPATLATINAAMQRNTFSADGRSARGQFPQRVVRSTVRLGQGDNAIDLIDLGENPHAEGYLLVSIPGRDLVYSTAFVYPVASPEQMVSESLPASRWLIHWMAAAGLAPALHYNVHGPQPLAEWQRAYLHDAVASD